MRILILGGNGMIGHKMYQIISKVNLDTWVTLRNNLNSYSYSKFYNSEKVIESIDLTNFQNLFNQLNTINPDVIINACGITIRRGVNQLKSKSIILNSALPHFLNEWVTSNNKRLIHFSTDCVFSGKKGDYEDNDIKDATDIYGLTKSMGEVIDSTFTITLRGSMIGRELENKTELFEWFLKQHNTTINGFSEVIYSGITSVKMADIVLNIIYNFPNLSGLFNVSSKAISKFDLLTLCNDYFKVDAFIKNDNSYSSNKNLISNKLFNELNMVQPAWNDLIKQLKQDCSENKNLYI
jgi:dTDP-4-dehydrorhamnose reductase